MQSVGGPFPMACGVDSRLRGNDDSVERRYLANDATAIQRGQSRNPRFQIPDSKFKPFDLRNQ
jgi:hypothetical protein